MKNSKTFQRKPRLLFSNNFGQSTAPSNQNVLAPKRGCAGQAIIESAVGLIVVVAIFVLITAFGLNVFFMTQYQAKASIVATEAAKVVGVKKYWLGMTRPDYNPQLAREKAHAVAVRLCRLFNLPAPSALFVEESSDENADYLSINMTISDLHLPFDIHGVLPGSSAQKSSVPQCSQKSRSMLQ